MFTARRAPRFSDINAVTLDKAIEWQSDDATKIEDIMAPLKDWRPTVGGDGAFAMEYTPSGRLYKPTDYCLGNMATWGGTSDWFLRSLRTPISKGKKTCDRDAIDADLLKHTLEVHLKRNDRIDQDKPFLWRTWKDGTLRCMRSDSYAIVNNIWVLEALKEAFPNGKLTHWRSDADTLSANIITQDHLALQTGGHTWLKDSDYGWGLSIGNSEIGERRLSTELFIIRCICTNGAIITKTVSRSNRVHRGNLDWEVERVNLIARAREQLKKGDDYVERLGHLKELTFEGVDPVRMVGQLSRDYRPIIGNNAGKVLDQWKTEVEVTGDEAKTLFGLQSAVTRFSQTQERDDWLKLDTLGGDLIEMSQDKWGRFVRNAKELDSESLSEIYGMPLLA